MSGQQRQRMSDAVRVELEDAVRTQSIRNLTAFSNEFAARHGLNPVSVRSAVSRLRRELGLVGRKRGAANPPAGGGSGRVFQAAPIEAMTLLAAHEVSDRAVIRIIAAALIRYSEDEKFRRAVDDERPKIENVYRRLIDFRESAESLPPEERDGLLRLLVSELSGDRP